MRIVYTDQGGATGGRTIWPIMIGFVDSQRLISAWCELRQDFRVFCADRIRRADFLGEHYPGNRRRLAKEWRGDYCRRGVVDRAAE